MFVLSHNLINPTATETWHMKANICNDDITGYFFTVKIHRRLINKLHADFFHTAATTIRFAAAWAAAEKLVSEGGSCCTPAAT
jgi:hypothetical protein